MPAEEKREHEITEEIIQPEEATGTAAAEIEAPGELESEADPPETPEDGADELPVLRRALAEKTAEAESLLNRLQRLQADFENFRRRTRREQEEMIGYAAEALITDLLPVVDNLERALQAGGQGGDLASFLDGIKMIYRQFWGVLEKQGLSPVEAVGLAFDPGQHHAVMQVETEEFAENTVVEELQKGYRLKEKVIRPALVKVAKPQ